MLAPMLAPMFRARIRSPLAALFGVAAIAGAARSQSRPATIDPDSAHAAAVAFLTQAINQEMRDLQLPALSIALVDGNRIVWAHGFGTADSARHLSANAETVYRVGAVSSLFTVLGVMQLAERKRIDLDSPVTRYLPGFHPSNPFGTTISVRQLVSQRSGLVREPPVGGYSDSTAPSLARTVMSLDSTSVVIAPGSRVKYSNAGMATAGYVIERVTRQPFASYLARSVLAPLGMNESSFQPTTALESRLATAYLWTYDGRRITAPRFRLGESPANGLYTTVTDLGRFMSAMLAGGPANSEIGFRLDTLDGMREVAQDGSIYGFSTALHMLPGERLGVVIITTLDATNAVAARVARAALRAMIASRRNAPMPLWVTTTPVIARDAARLEGRYFAADSAIELTYLAAPSDSDASATQLVERSTAGGTRGALRLLGDTLVRDDRLGFGARLVPRGDTLIAASRSFVRAPDAKPSATPPQLRRLVGEYGWDHDILYILEDRGWIDALSDWFYQSPLERTSDSTFRFPVGSRFDSEPVAFAFDGAGAVTGVRIGGRWLPRRAIGPASGNQLHVTPVRPLADLEREARAATPPHEAPHPRAADLVELVSLDSTIHLEIRYATTNNFLGTRFYPQARAFLQRPAAEALVRAHRALKKSGYGILVHDSYRPWYVTRMFWDAVPADKKIFVADPADGSRHNRGAAADISLYDLATGKPVDMVSTYDETSDRAFANYPGGTSLERWLRALLRHAMEAEGFTVYHAEWWHFDYKGWNEYPILNIPYDQIPGGATAPRAP